MSFDQINEEVKKSGGQFVKLTRKEHGVLEFEIVDAEVRTKTFEGAEVLSKKGKPRKEWLFVFNVKPETPDDDGVRKFAANESAQFAIRDAVKAAGGKIEKGGTIKIAVKTDPENSRSQAEYQAKYTPPTKVADPFEDDSDDEVPF